MISVESDTQWEYYEGQNFNLKFRLTRKKCPELYLYALLVGITGKVAVINGEISSLLSVVIQFKTAYSVSTDYHSQKLLCHKVN